MKKIVGLLIFFFAVCLGAEKDMPSGVSLTFAPKGMDFRDALADKFGNSADIWMVLGNRGIKNLYRERFSSHWVFWDYQTADDVVGISGDCFNINNWVHISKFFPHTVSYIAVNFNSLIHHKRKNKIIKAALPILSKGGVFCLEDDFIVAEKRFENFSEEDFKELSHDFQIKFARWDGYVAALPYTSYPGENRRRGLYRGVELTILRLAAASHAERKQMLPYVSSGVIFRGDMISDSFTEFLINDIICSPKLDQLIENYEHFAEKLEQISADIETEQKELALLKDDEEGYKKIDELKATTPKRFITEKDLDKKTSMVPNSLTNKEISKLFSSDDEIAELKKKLDESKETAADKESKLKELQYYYDLVRKKAENAENEIKLYQNKVFEIFENDKFLKKYVSYKKETIEDILRLHRDITSEFWSTFDGSSSSVSGLEALARELENSWSPHVILNNLMTLDELKKNSENFIDDVQKILVVLIKKQDIN